MQQQFPLSATVLADPPRFLAGAQLVEHLKMFSESFYEEKVARQRERFFRAGNGRKFLDKIIPP